MTKKSKFYETDNKHINKHKLKKDTKQSIVQAVSILSKSKSVEDAAELLNMSSRQLRKLFIDNGMLTPSSYLPQINTDLTKNQKQKIKELYSEFGGEKTATEIAELLQINLELVQEFIKQHKITHKSLPIENTSDLEPDKIKKLQEIINYKVKAKVESLELVNLKRDAEKWRLWEQTVGDKLFALLDKRISAYEVEKLQYTDTEKPYAALLCINDFHFGRLASKLEVNEHTDMNIQEEDLFNNLAVVLSRARKFGKGEEVFLTIGSDFLNSDNYQGTTTAGTKQDSYPSHTVLLVHGSLLYVKLVDYLRQFFTKVRLCPNSGNHDSVSTVSMYLYLCAWFKDCDDVDTNFQELNFRSRQYRKYGNTLLMFGHGEIPIKDIPGVILNEAREFVGCTKHTIYVSGHMHHKVIDHQGIVWCQTPSLAKDDRWSYGKGYQAKNGLSMILVDKETGYMAEISS